jgi:hypothetical protein
MWSGFFSQGFPQANRRSLGYKIGAASAASIPLMMGVDTPSRPAWFVVDSRAV